MSRSRDGRLLVECMVATVLLGATGAAAGVTTRAVAGLADDARSVSRARELMVEASEMAISLPCGVSPGLARSYGRIDVAGTTVNDSGVATILTRARIRYSPLAGRAPFTLSMAAARRCE